MSRPPIHCNARNCTYCPDDGWVVVKKRCRRHGYCPEHEIQSDLDHKAYKAVEKECVFVRFENDDIKKAIKLRQEWADKYLRKPDRVENAHPAFVRLLEALLETPIERRKTVSEKLLREFNKRF
jgi:hypothetical protein